MHELIIIGGGPAACAAGVYAGRKRLNTLFLTKAFDGQSVVSPDVQNWIGSISISGEALVRSLKEHVLAYAGDSLTVREDSEVVSVTGTTGAFTVTTKDGASYTGKTVLVATGASRRKITVPGAEQFEHKGVTYCASCDGPLFSGMKVAVIGGGNAGFESAAQLLAYAKHVTLIERDPRFRAEPITVEKVLAHEHMHGVANAELLEIRGNGMVNELLYKDRETGETTTLPVSGVFVEIGTIPNTDMVKEVVTLNPHGHVTTDPRTQRTSCEGIWAAGDCTDGLYAQNNIAAGDAVKALEDIYLYVRS